jgi:hypothetical protein
MGTRGKTSCGTRTEEIPEETLVDGRTKDRWMDVILGARNRNHIYQNAKLYSVTFNWRAGNGEGELRGSYPALQGVGVMLREKG